MHTTNHLPSGFVNQLQRMPTDDTARGVGEEALEVTTEFETASLHYSEPVSRLQPVKKFDSLSATWQHDNDITSSASEIILTPAYQEIIGMGKAAIPLILDELKKENNYWFWALSAITGVNPIKPEDRGNIPKMSEAWLEWGRQNNYIDQ